MPEARRDSRSLFRPGLNCWRTARAARLAVLVDGAAYFDAFASAAQQARRSILILAWDFNSQTVLRVGPNGDALLLGEFLNSLVRHHLRLQVRVLIWDYPMIFGTDREFPPIYGLGWRPHRRVKVRYDNTHPVAGCHHQKVVVIDDRIAFCGGLDLTTKRWDTREHRAEDPRRAVNGSGYPPFHDTMMMVDAEAASALGELARQRWRAATGRTVRAVPVQYDPWPQQYSPLVGDARVAVSRTQPPADNRAPLREVEELYLDMIAAARNCIYIENQYFTSLRVGDALAARLAQAQGPEIVVVLRLLSHGWLEELTMQNLRRRLIERLRQADRGGRFHVYYPFIAGLPSGTCIDMHAKLMIVDDEWLRIGSSNICNRSMGLDSECDLTLEAGGRSEVAQRIREVRDDLLAEHLGAERARVAERIQAFGSISAAIEELGTAQRSLRRLEIEDKVPEALLNLASLVDPEQPVALEKLEAELGPRAVKRRSPWSRVAVAALVLAGLAALWRFTPLASLVTADRITDWADRFAHNPWAAVLVVSAYTPAAVTLFPRPLITLFGVVAFGPWLGFTYAMCGILLAALLSYLAGLRLDRGTVRRLAGPKLNHMIEQLRQRGLIAMTALRLVPLAPFVVEGVVAGAIRMRLRDFMLGTAIGVLPGTLAATVFGHQLEAALRDPRQVNLWLIALVVAVFAVATFAVRRWLSTAQSHERAPARQ
ncbi:MAG TPA: VTT domain-containing protein [Steroidobacteraceae bacterium]|nr:VTT domain-containing protein [Steroidobacteraceae bacterium]